MNTMTPMHNWNIWLETLPRWAALLPLAGYLFMLAWVHVRRRPSIVSGTRDGVLLAISVAGLAIAGPLALVRPAFGGAPWGWSIMLLLFGLVVAVCTLAARPRLVVYNVSPEQLRPLVAEVVTGLDAHARWAGASVVLPSRRLQLHLDGSGGMRCSSIVAVGERAALEGWAEFGRRLRQAAVRMRVRPSPWAALFAAAGFAALAGAGWAAIG